MKEYTKKEIRKILIETSSIYEKNLSDNDFLIIYRKAKDKKNNYKFIEIKYRPENFLHLTGLVSNYNPTDFYNLCTSKGVQIQDFAIKDDTTFKKMDVLMLGINLLNKKGKQIGIYNNSHVDLKFDKGIGKQDVTIGYGLENNKKSYYPKTLLDEDINKLIEEESKGLVRAILKKHKDDNIYEKIVRFEKDFSTFDLRDEISSKISNVVLEEIAYKNRIYQEKALNSVIKQKTKLINKVKHLYKTSKNLDHSLQQTKKILEENKDKMDKMNYLNHNLPRVINYYNDIIEILDECKDENLFDLKIKYAEEKKANNKNGHLHFKIHEVIDIIDEGIEFLYDNGKDEVADVFLDMVDSSLRKEDIDKIVKKINEYLK